MNPIDAHAPTFYQDTSKLKNLKGREGLEAAAGQFEAMFLQMVLKNMRDATNAIGGENSVFNSKQQQFYQEMADGQMASDLGSRGGLGIADALVRQLDQNVNGHSGEELKKSGQAVASDTVTTAAFQQPLNVPRDSEEH